MEFTDQGRNEDFFKALNLDPILDKDIVVKEKDLGDDECEVEMRTNIVVTLLMSLGYCYLRLHNYQEAYKNLDYALTLAPTAPDVLYRRSQTLTYHRHSTIAQLKQAMQDVDKAIEKRPKDKIYKQHKEKVDQTIRDRITKEVSFINKLVEKATSELVLKRRLKHFRKLK